MEATVTATGNEAAVTESTLNPTQEAVKMNTDVNTAADAAAIPSTLTSDTADNSVLINIADNTYMSAVSDHAGTDISPVATPATRTISEAQYMQFLAAQQTAKEYVLAKKIKEHNSIFSPRRLTVAYRRVDLKAIAPDLDVVAYIEISNMKEAIGQDASASDTEIAAYVELWNSDGDLTLDAINQKLQSATA